MEGSKAPRSVLASKRHCRSSRRRRCGSGRFVAVVQALGVQTRYGASGGGRRGDASERQGLHVSRARQATQPWSVRRRTRCPWSPWTRRRPRDRLARPSSPSGRGRPALSPLEGGPWIWTRSWRGGGAEEAEGGFVAFIRRRHGVSWTRHRDGGWWTTCTPTTPITQPKVPRRPELVGLAHDQCSMSPLAATISRLNSRKCLSFDFTTQTMNTTRSMRQNVRVSFMSSSKVMSRAGPSRPILQHQVPRLEHVFR